MIPISDDNPTLRTPVITGALLLALGAVWVMVQGAGLSPQKLVASVCNWGLVPGEITGRAPLGQAIKMTASAACIVDDEARNLWTPLTSMFLHGGWMHLLGNGLFLWIFGNNVEDSMGRVRFPIFYALCGLAAAAAQVAINPASPVPMVGASGAIAGVLGAYLVLYPRVRVNVFFPPFFFFSVPAWLMLLWWIGVQLASGLPQLSALKPQVSSGVAVWAHIGGFVAGVILVKPFENRRLVGERTAIRHRLHPDHP
jgi:membrane associated rhomboid family serine protease